MSKFYNGTIPWSPELQGYRDTVDYWTQILRTKTNVATSKNIIKRLSLKLGLYAGHYLSAADALVSLKRAWKDYKAAKKIAVTFWKDLLQSIIDRLAME